MDNTAQITKAINEHYKMFPEKIVHTNGGWSALAFSFIWQENMFFLKVYDKAVSSTAKLTKSLETYLPVLHWLETNTALHGKISKIIKGKDGNLLYYDKDFIYILFSFIKGNTIGNNTMTAQQVKDLSEIISCLHKVAPESIPFSTKNIIERFSLDFSSSLRKILVECSKLANGAILKDISSTYEKSINKKLDDLEKLACELHKEPPAFVLCHTDIHFENIMQGKNIVLIDWEGMKLAPAEADLFMLKDNGWWPDFFEIYKNHNPLYIMNEKAMDFFSLRRTLEDIWEFMERLLLDDFDENEKNEMIKYLLLECDKIEKC